MWFNRGIPPDAADNKKPRLRRRERGFALYARQHGGYETGETAAVSLPRVNRDQLRTRSAAAVAVT